MEKIVVCSKVNTCPLPPETVCVHRKPHVEIFSCDLECRYGHCMCIPIESDEI